MLFRSRRADEDWLGCNVTIPHKIAVMDFVQDPSGIRDSIGAMNTIACETGGPLIGTNTDAGGFLQPLQANEWRGDHAVIIGAGGAARAVLFALSHVGVKRFTVIARDAAKGQGLLKQAKVAGDVIGFDAPAPADCDLLVNCSPLGMVGQAALDIDLSAMSVGATVYDIVYNPLDTQLLLDARARGMRTIDGLEMLIGQAALAFEIFFDAVPPRELDEDLRALILG